MQPITPAILTDQPEVLLERAKTFGKFSDLIHVDLMDGQFVPDASVPALTINKIDSQANIEVHLMIKEPLRPVSTCLEIKNVSHICVHAEISSALLELLSQIKSRGKQAGLAIRPETAIEDIQELVTKANYVLLMGVIPGKQGQKFLPETLQRITTLKNLMPSMPIVVDGGMNAATIAEVAKAGVQRAIVGSAIVQSDNPQKTFQDLTTLFQNSV